MPSFGIFGSKKKSKSTLTLAGTNTKCLLGFHEVLLPFVKLRVCRRASNLKSFLSLTLVGDLFNVMMVQGTSGKGRETDREAVTVWRLMDTTER